MPHPEAAIPSAAPPRSAARPGRGSRRLAVTAAVAIVALLWPGLASTAAPESTPTATTITSGLQGTSGSALGPDGALYVPEGTTGTIARVDPHTGATTTWATGLPAARLPIGGVVDIAFLDGVAHALVSLIIPAPDEVVGIYRMDGPDTWTPITDLGAYAIANPAPFPVDVPTGVLYSLETWRGGFLVTDGHLNRLMHVTGDGNVAAVMQLDNVVPTGTATRGNQILLGLAGPTPHVPADGRAVAVELDTDVTDHVAAGAPLLVDVVLGRGNEVFGLAQGEFTPGLPPATPAMPDTGSLMVARDGQFEDLVTGLDRPTSLEMRGRTAWVVTLTGTVIRLDDLPPPGRT